MEVHQAEMYVHFRHPQGSFQLLEGTDLDCFSAYARDMATTPSIDEKMAICTRLMEHLVCPTEPEDDVKRFRRLVPYIISLATSMVPVESEVTEVRRTSRLPWATCDAEGATYVLCQYSRSPTNPFFPLPTGDEALKRFADVVEFSFMVTGRKLVVPTALLTAGSAYFRRLVNENPFTGEEKIRLISSPQGGIALFELCGFLHTGLVLPNWGGRMISASDEVPDWPLSFINGSDVFDPELAALLWTLSEKYEVEGLRECIVKRIGERSQSISATQLLEFVNLTRPAAELQDQIFGECHFGMSADDVEDVAGLVRNLYNLTEGVEVPPWAISIMRTCKKLALSEVAMSESCAMQFLRNRTNQLRRMLDDLDRIDLKGSAQDPNPLEPGTPENVYQKLLSQTFFNRDDFRAVTSNELWRTLPAETAQTILDSDMVDVDEIDVFRALRSWNAVKVFVRKSKLTHKYRRRARKVNDFDVSPSVVRVPLINPTLLKSEVEPSGLMRKDDLLQEHELASQQRVTFDLRHQEKTSVDIHFPQFRGEGQLHVAIGEQRDHPALRIHLQHQFLSASEETLFLHCYVNRRYTLLEMSLSKPECHWDLPIRTLEAVAVIFISLSEDKSRSH